MLVSEPKVKLIATADEFIKKNGSRIGNRNDSRLMIIYFLVNKENIRKDVKVLILEEY
jgi:hypothetical protein